MQFCVFCVYYWCLVVSFKLVGLSDKLRCHYASNQVLVKLLTSELQHPTTFLTQTDSLTRRPPLRSKRPGPQRWLKRQAFNLSLLHGHFLYLYSQMWHHLCLWSEIVREFLLLSNCSMFWYLIWDLLLFPLRYDISCTWESLLKQHNKSFT